MSIIIKIFIRIYILLTLKSLLFLEENTNTTIESMELEVPTVNYNKTDLFIFSSIKMQKSQKPVKIDNELRSYIDIFFEQIYNDYTSGTENK